MAEGITKQEGTHQDRRHRRRPGRVRRRAAGRAPRRRGHSGRERPHRRHLPQPGLHPHQGAARQRRGARPGAGGRGVRVRGGRRDQARLRPHDGAQGRDRHPAARERRGPAQEGRRGGAAGHRQAGRTRQGRRWSERGIGGGTVTVEADKIIIATGSEPARLPMFDFDHPTILTSTEALALDKIPESLLIVGAGVIGCEFASFYSELGTKITMVEMLPQMLPLEDLRLAKQFQSTYRKRGIQVLLKTKVESISEYADDHVTAKLSDGSEITAEKILVSVGRKPNTRRHRPGDGRGGGRPARLRGRERLPGDHGARRLRHRRRQRRPDAGPRRLLRGLRGGGQLPGRRGGRATCARRPRAPTPRRKWRAWD